MKNPYGLKDGVLVTPDQVERGLACGCTCPACGGRLEAHKGNIKEHYFAHYSSEECGGGLETALHLMAKDVLSKSRKMLLPELKARPERSLWQKGTVLPTKHVVNPWTRVPIDSVQVEHRFRDFIPDLVISAKGRQLLVEIKVTHGIDEDKLTKIEEAGVGVVEFDFSRFRRAPTTADLRRVFVKTYVPKGCGRSWWVYHPNHADAVSEMNEVYREQLAKQASAESTSQSSASEPTNSASHDDLGSLFDEHGSEGRMI